MSHTRLLKETIVEQFEDQLPSSKAGLMTAEQKEQLQDGFSFGVCNGVAWMAALSFIKERLGQFTDDLIEFDSKGKSLLSTSSQARYWQQFLYHLAILQAPQLSSNYNSQTDDHRVMSEVIAPDIQTDEAKLAFVNAEKLTAIFKMFESAANRQEGDQVLSAVLNSGDHAIMIGYDSANKKWAYCNVWMVEFSWQTTDLRVIIELVFGAFKVSPNQSFWLTWRLMGDTDAFPKVLDSLDTMEKYHSVQSDPIRDHDKFNASKPRLTLAYWYRKLNKVKDLERWFAHGSDMWRLEDYQLSLNASVIFGHKEMIEYTVTHIATQVADHALLKGMLEKAMFLARLLGQPKTRALLVRLYESMTSVEHAALRTRMLPLLVDTHHSTGDKKTPVHAYPHQQYTKKAPVYPC